MSFVNVNYSRTTSPIYVIPISLPTTLLAGVGDSYPAQVAIPSSVAESAIAPQQWLATIDEHRQVVGYSTFYAIEMKASIGREKARHL